MRFSVKLMTLPALAAAFLCLSVPPARGADDGAALYKQRCSGCHGVDGKGQTTMGRMFHLQSLTSAAVQNMTDAQLHQIVANGKGKMPAFKNSLSTAKIDAIIAHLRQLAKAN